MKKITLLVFFFSMATFAQKDELKSLKKLYNITSAPSDKDVQKFNALLTSLDGMTTLDANQKNEYNFYKGVQSIIDVVKTVYNNPNNPESVSKVISYDKISTTYSNFNKVKEFEKNAPNKELTTEIDSKITPFLNTYIKNKAYSTYKAKNLSESSKLFYLLYEINNSDILNLENAAQVAIESNNYVESLKYYTELKNNEYLNSGKLYYAYNKISEKEDQFSTLEERNNAIKMPNYEKPREEPASTKKPFVYKTVAILLVENKQIEEAKKVYKDAKILNPDDMEILTSEASLYYPNDMETYKSLIKEIVVKDPNNAIMFYNIGYATLIDDAKIVDKINSNLNNPEVYKELTTKRKEMYQSALPFFEKSYKLDPSIEDTKQILKATYKILGMKEEEAKL